MWQILAGNAPQRRYTLYIKRSLIQALQGQVQEILLKKGDTFLTKLLGRLFNSQIAIRDIIVVALGYPQDSLQTPIRQSPVIYRGHVLLSIQSSQSQRPYLLKDLSLSLIYSIYIIIPYSPLSIKSLIFKSFILRLEGQLAQ